MPIKHSFVSAAGAASDPNLVDGNDWNADHVLTGTGVNVRDYGAVGNGTTDDTTAIANAAAASAAIYGGIRLYFPQGAYLYTGTGIWDQQGVAVIGDGLEKTRIVLGAGVSFIAGSTLLYNLLLRDLTVDGGFGAFTGTFTGSNVVHQYVIYNVLFINYTGCAVGHNSVDMPYWKIKDCIFRGANNTTTIGVALTGLTDLNELVGCSFINNRIHAKIGYGGNNMHIKHCDFIQFNPMTTGSPRVSVWVVPDSDIVNAGPGFTIKDSKFGNENLNVADYRVLYADQSGATSTNFHTALFTVAADSAGYIIGHQISGCLVNGSGGAGQPFVYTTTPNVRASRIGDLVIAGTPPSYLIQHRTTPRTDRHNADNVFGPFVFDNPDITPNSVNMGVSPDMGEVLDPNGQYDYGPNAMHLHKGSSDFTEFVKLLPTTGIRTFTLGATATRSNVADVLGGIDAAELTIPSSALVYSSIGTFTPGRPIWLEFDVKAGASTPMNKFQITLEFDNNGPTQILRQIAPTSGWVRYKFAGRMREATATNGASVVNFAIRPVAGSSPTSGTKVQIGRVRIYHGREPVMMDAINQGSLTLALGSRLLSTQTTAPTAAVGANAGTSPPAPVVVAGSTDVRGTITFGSGSGTPAVGTYAVVTFNRAYITAPNVILTPANSATAVKSPYVTSTATTFTIGLGVAAATSQANTVYSVNYQIVG